MGVGRGRDGGGTEAGRGRIGGGPEADRGRVGGGSDAHQNRLLLYSSPWCATERARKNTVSGTRRSCIALISLGRVILAM